MQQYTTRAPISHQVPVLAWHYTVGMKLPLIRESGVIKPTDVYIEPDERPVSWWSTNPYWEPTSAKGLATGGESRTLSMQENAEMGEGLYRFGLSVSALIRWPEIGKRAGIRAPMRNALMRVGRKQGSDPAQWYGTFHEIPIQGLIFQQLIDFRYWATKERIAHREQQLAQIALYEVKVRTIPVSELRGDAKERVNHIRHRGTPYHKLLEKYDAGDKAILSAIRSRVYRAISATYPELTEECDRQLVERQNGEATVNLTN